jgi:hypothetical protein
VEKYVSPFSSRFDVSDIIGIGQKTVVENPVNIPMMLQ